MTFLLLVLVWKRQKKHMKKEIGQTTVFFFVGETPSNSINRSVFSFVGSFCCFRGNYFWKVWDGAGMELED